MRIFSHKDSSNSSIFGNKIVAKPTSENKSNVDWNSFFTKKSYLIENSILPGSKDLSSRKCPGGDYGTGSVIGMSRLYGSEEMKSEISKTSKNDILKEKDSIRKIKADLDKEYRSIKVEDSIIPKLNTLSKCSSETGGKENNPINSVSIFDKNPFDHIKNKESKVEKLVEARNSKKTPVKTDDLLNRVFSSLSNKDKNIKENKTINKSIFDSI
jgi:hypothetical protein